MEPLEGVVAAVERGRARWPGIVLSQTEFEAQLARIEATAESLADHAEEIFLVAACLTGNTTAFQEFDKTFLSRVGTLISRVSTDADLIDEVKQQLRIRLFTGKDPRLAHYRGEGALEGWVRVAAMRTALNTLESRKRDRHVEIDDNRLGNALSPFLSADHLVAGAELQPVVQKALTVALEQLPARNKAILRLHFVEHLNIEEIGLVYRVHRATIARWLVTIRRDLLSRVQEHMEVRLQVSPSEFRSLVEAVRGDLHASLSRILPANPPDATRAASQKI